MGFHRIWYCLRANVFCSLNIFINVRHYIWIVTVLSTVSSRCLDIFHEIKVNLSTGFRERAFVWLFCKCTHIILKSNFPFEYLFTRKFFSNKTKIFICISGLCWEKLWKCRWWGSLQSSNASHLSLVVRRGSRWSPARPAPHSLTLRHKYPQWSWLLIKVYSPSQFANTVILHFLRRAPLLYSFCRVVHELKDTPVRSRCLFFGERVVYV